MLSLFIERAIENQLRKSRNKKTAAEVFEELSTCHLNLVRSEHQPELVYIRTVPTQEQFSTLKTLRMKDLIDPETIEEKIDPRRKL